MLGSYCSYTPVSATLLLTELSLCTYLLTYFLTFELAAFSLVLVHSNPPNLVDYCRQMVTVAYGWN
jgi:hypothetical protein